MGKMVRVVAILGVLLGVGTHNTLARTTEGAQVRTVITGVQQGTVAFSGRLGRVVVLGQADDGHTPGSVLAIVDSVHEHLVARITPGLSVTGMALDEQRGRAYITVGASTTTGPQLWAVDLRAGHVLFKSNISAGGLPGSTLVAVDEPTGHVFITLWPTYGKVLLAMFDAEGQLAQTQVLPDNTYSYHLLVDSARHRLIIDPSLNTYNAAIPTTLAAFDTRTEAPEWTRPLDYRPVAMTLDRATGRLWVLAPGGRVTTFETRTGQITARIRMTYEPPAGWSQSSFVVDTQRSAAFIGWCASGCGIDRADTRTQKRRIIASQVTTFNTLSLVGVDTRHGWLLALTPPSNSAPAGLDAYDERTGLLGRHVAAVPLVYGQPSGIVCVTASDNGHEYMAIMATVPYQDDETGSTTAGGLILVTLPA